MSPLREVVRGIDLWGYEVGLPDADPAFQSSCYGNSYCKKNVVRYHHGIILRKKLHTNTAKMYSGDHQWH